MNPFRTPEIASGYEAWYEAEGRRADRLEKALLARLLRRFPEGASVLDVGAGTGHFTRWFAEQGLAATGLDPSPAMLAEARSRSGPDYVEGVAGALPFEDGAFDVVAFVTSLEFVEDIREALREARRVGRRGLLIGALNARSRLGRSYRRAGGPVWEAAHFFTVRELRRLVEQAAPSADVTWRTTLWPRWPGALPLPWGGFIGLAARWA